MLISDLNHLESLTEIAEIEGAGEAFADAIAEAKAQAQTYADTFTYTHTDAYAFLGFKLAKSDSVSYSEAYT